MNSAIILIILLGVFSIVAAIVAMRDTQRKSQQANKKQENSSSKKITLSTEQFSADIENYIDKLHSHEYQRINIYQYSKEESEVTVIHIDEYEELCKKYQIYKELKTNNKEENIIDSLKEIHKKLDTLSDDVLVIRDLK